MNDQAGNYLTKINWGEYQRKVLLCASESEALLIVIIMLLPTIDINSNALLSVEKSNWALIINLSALLTSSYFLKKLQQISHVKVYKNWGFLLLLGLIILLFSSSILEIYISMIIIGIGLGADLAFNFHILCDSSPPTGRNHFKWISCGIDFINILIYCGIFTLQYAKIDIFSCWRVIVFLFILIHGVFMFCRSSLCESPLLLYSQGKSEDLKGSLKTIAAVNGVQNFDININDLESHQASNKYSLEHILKPPLSSVTFKFLAMTALTFSSFIGFALLVPELVSASGKSETIGILAVMKIYGLMGKFLSSIFIGSKFNRKITSIITNFVIGACALNFYRSSEFYHYIRYSVIYGVSSSIGIVSLYSLIQDSYASEYWGMAYMLKNHMECIGSMVSSIIFGVFIDYFGSGNILIGFGVASFCAGLIGISLEINSNNDDKIN